ncbi:nuclear transport factor 2 family protein [Pseudohalioglobus lutimaris]|uniref:SnoaL-like domain-containing protein n=1 Tax=Pseudohalioglobus lutimaris TaxID=1737061 RepID=A0A2N5X338_9GAMM|nr:nuclear transport factor 2 family protein [Pseudohalioglobus lutimaris]PLW68870.1 hypothetical protein C0039_09590 [Pseudohalioglobus lutimaris]
MGRWTRDELEHAFDRYQAAALKGAQEGDWRDWADMFTVDATYFEHQYGRFWGRENIYQWISKTMGAFPASSMTAFPIRWYSIDEDKGWVICEVLNRMQDLGDGQIYEEPNLTVLHYAGNGLFSYEEDAYDRKRMGEMIVRWLKTKERLEQA